MNPGLMLDHPESYAQLEERINWLKNWIDHPLDPQQTPQDAAQRERLETEARRGLIYAITGRDTLLSGESINIVFTHLEQPSCHTCFNTVDLPMSLDTESEFRAELRALSALRGLNAQ